MSGSCRIRLALTGLAVFVFAPAPAWAIWPVDPNANLTVCAAPGDQKNATLLPDGEGGAYITWWDYRSGESDVYLQRVDFAGVPKWTANGIALSSAPGAQWAASLVTDGQGGCIVCWPDSSLGQNNARRYVQRVDASGKTLWTPGGVRVCPVEADEYSVAMLADGTRGGREPRIAAVQDIGPDQGGRARVLWEPSDLDAGSPPTGIKSYSMWRRVITTSAQQPDAAGTLLFAGADPRPLTGESQRPPAAPDGAEATYWEYLVTLPAVGETGYAYTAATTADSMPGLIPWNVFRVMAESAYGPWYSSAPDSGYSVDNLPPGAPATLTAALASGSTALHWSVSGEPDLAGYRLYRGLSAEFIPGPRNLVSATPDTGYVDIGQAGRYYRVSAMDVHGNESAFALVTPSATLAVPAPAALQLLLEPVRPNPSTGASLTVRFVLPAGAWSSPWGATP